MVQDLHFAKRSMNIQHSIYICCRAYHPNIKQEVRKRQADGREQRNRQQCSMWYEGVIAHQQPHFANFGGFVFLALFSGDQSKGVLMRVWRRIMRYFCRCLQGVPPHSKGQHVQRHFEKQVSNGGWHLSSFETRGPDADLIYTGESCNSCEVNEVPVA